MEYCYLCVCSTRHIAPPNGIGQTEVKTDYKKVFPVNSNAVVLGTCKMRFSQDGWKGKKNNTAQRLYRKHKKHTEDNKAHRKHRHSEGDG